MNASLDAEVFVVSHLGSCLERLSLSSLGPGPERVQENVVEFHSLTLFVKVLVEVLRPQIVVPQDCSIRDVRNIIMEMVTVPWAFDSAFLFLDGKELDFSATLQDYSIENGATILVVSRGRRESALIYSSPELEWR